VKQLVSSLAVALLVWSLAAADALAKGRWQRIENKANCVVWSPGIVTGKSTVTWTGICSNGKAYGRGTMEWRYFKDSRRMELSFTGTMRDGLMHGSGTLTYSSGNRYEGDFKGSSMHGWGEFLFANGNRYQGEFKESKMHGRGVYDHADGSGYEGQLREDLKHGHGVFIFASGNSRYEGELKDDTMHGRGVFKFTSGNECGGDWRNGKLLLGTGNGIQNGQPKKCRFENGLVEFFD